MTSGPTFEFESGAFPLLPEEDDEVNPHIHGKSLAMWMRERLRAEGYTFCEPFKEDFGWYMDGGEKPNIFAVTCAGETPNEWMVFASVTGGMWAKLTGKDKSAELLAPLVDALRRVLRAEPSIRNLKEDGEPVV